MPDKVWDALANWSIGLTVVAVWFLWLKYGKKPGNGVNVDMSRLIRWHEENRDAIRDTNKTVKEIEALQDREIEHLNNLVNSQVRVAELLKEITGELRDLQSRRSG